MRRYLVALAAVLAAAGPAGASELEQNYPVSELYVMSAETAHIDGDRLTFSGVDQNVIWFTDRPARRSGRADTYIFIANWPIGADSFAVDPPNGVLVGGSDAGEVELPLELMDPEWAEDDLILRIADIGTPIPQTLSLSAVHLFIDNQSANGATPAGWCGQECFFVYWPIGAPDLVQSER